MQKRYIVHKRDLDKGAATEAREHPWASPRRARRIARDHLQANGPGYYRAEPVQERATKAINAKMHANPVKPRVPSRPFDPLRDDPFKYFGNPIVRRNTFRRM